MTRNLKARSYNRFAGEADTFAKIQGGKKCDLFTHEGKQTQCALTQFEKNKGMLSFRL